VFEPPE
jgi:hypothetical protein